MFWMVGGPILVERLSWIRLCAQVMALLHALGMGDQQGPPLQLSPWPDRALLEAAIARAAGVFCLFARADPAAASIRSLLAQNDVCRAAAAVALPSSAAGRAAKRRRSDLDHSEPPPALDPP